MNDDQLKKISLEYGTPLYVYDSEIIKRQYFCLKNSLPECFEIFYSIKTNPLLGICELFRKLGSNIEVASSGELFIALSAGFSPEQIIFTSPGKSYDELEYAIETGIYSINIESIEEARMIDAIAKKKSKKVNISIRINPDFDVSGASIKMTGVPTQFGIDQQQVGDAIGILKSLTNTDIIGIHIFTGTQVLNYNNIVANMEAVIKLSLDLSSRYKFDLKFLDLGGGFGIAYTNTETDLDIEKMKQGIYEVWKRYSQNFIKTKVAVESGRFLMADAGVYLTKVLYCKVNKEKQYIICDGGSNHHANSAFLGRHVRNNFPMHILEKDNDKIEINAAGPLCTPTDIVGQKVMLPKAKTGDILCVDKSGAYGLTNSPILFLSHELPAEIISFENSISILRERGKKEDFLNRQRSLL